jgi:IS5 family transposase
VHEHVRNWSYERLQWEVTGNVAYRDFCRIGGHKVPDAKTMVRYGLLLDESVLEPELI